MEKNSDKSHGSTGMFPHQFGRFLPLVGHLPSENSILSNFSSPRGVAILGCESHSQAGSATKLRRCASQLETLCRKSLGQINQPLWPKLSPNYMLMSIFFIWFWMVDCKTIDSMAMVRWSKTIEKPLIPMVQAWKNNWQQWLNCKNPSENHWLQWFLLKNHRPFHRPKKTPSLWSSGKILSHLEKYTLKTIQSNNLSSIRIRPRRWCFF